MKLAIDVHHLLLEHAGTRRLTCNMLEQFYTRTDVEVVELSPPYSINQGRGILGKLLRHLLRFFWVQIQLPILCLLKNIDLLLSPEFNTPLYTHCKRAVIVPDANMRSQKEFTSSIWFYCYYVPFIEKAIRRADLVFTISEFAKKQIVELMKLDDRKVKAIYLGIDKRFLAEDNQLSEVAKQGLSDKKYILFVGTFEARKNIVRLIEAFALLKKRHEFEMKEIKLAIIGKPAGSVFSDRSRQIDEVIKKYRLEDYVVLCGYVSDNSLPSFYRGALIVAFPSLHEGFGFPIIEGFASGVPVLTSNVTSMPEIAGNAAILVDPYDINDIENKLRMLILDKKLRDNLILAGQERIKEFTWECCVNTMVNYLHRLLL